MMIADYAMDAVAEERYSGIFTPRILIALMGGLTSPRHAKNSLMLA